MSQVDYPDFIRVEQWIGNPSVDLIGANLPANNTFGPFYMSPWEALSLLIRTVVAGTPIINVTVNWWQDQAMTAPIISQHMVGTAGATITDTLPVLGPWVSVDYGVGAVGAVSDVILQPRRGVHGRAKLLDNTTLVSSFGHLIGAGGNNIVYPNVITSGRAMLTVDSQDAGVWNARLDVLDSGLNAVNTIGVLRGTAGYQDNMHEVYLPDAPLRVIVFNTDGINHFFDVSIVLDVAY